METLLGNFCVVKVFRDYTANAFFFDKLMPDDDRIFKVCDEIKLSALIAYRAASRIWPDVMRAGSSIEAKNAGVRMSWVGYDWSQYEYDEGRSIPRWLEEKLRQVRPIADSGADLILAARLCSEEAVVSKRSKTGQRPLTAGEIIENWEEMVPMLLHRYGVSENQLSTAFADECRALASLVSPPPPPPIADPTPPPTPQDSGGSSSIAPAGGLLYPGVAEVLRRSLSRGCELYMTTMIGGDLVEAVLRRAGVAVPAGRVVACASEADKAKRLAEVVLRNRGREVHVVEDGAGVLRALAGDLRLAADGVALHFAGWGYSTPRQRASVAAWPRVKPLGRDRFDALLLGPTGSGPAAQGPPD